MAKKPKSEAEYGEQYDCDVRTIRRWKKEGAPLDDPAKMKAWIGARHCGPMGSQPKDLTAAKMKKVMLECERLELRNSIELGRYIARDEYKQKATQAVAQFRASLNGLRGDAPQWSGLPAHEILQRVTSRIDATFRELEAAFKAMANG